MNDQEFENLIAEKFRRSFVNVRPDQALLRKVFEAARQRTQRHNFSLLLRFRQFINIRTATAGAAAIIAVLIIGFVFEKKSQNNVYTQFASGNAFFPDVAQEQSMIGRDFDFAPNSAAANQELDSIKAIYDQNSF